MLNKYIQMALDLEWVALQLLLCCYKSYRHVP